MNTWSLLSMALVLGLPLGLIGVALWLTDGGQWSGVDAARTHHLEPRRRGGRHG